ncbi:MAG: hypothetical protein KBC72_00420 [Acinetobacter sp.]|nr:hypothetical protein [Acinetobacter sp.]
MAAKNNTASYTITWRNSNGINLVGSCNGNGFIIDIDLSKKFDLAPEYYLPEKHIRKAYKEISLMFKALSKKIKPKEKKK